MGSFLTAPLGHFVSILHIKWITRLTSIQRKSLEKNNAMSLSHNQITDMQNHTTSCYGKACKNVECRKL